MKQISIIDALRKGQSLPNATAWKWAGLVAGLAGYALYLVTAYMASQGWIVAELPVDTAVTVISAVIGAIATIVGQVATTDKIGLLPPKKSAEEGHEQ